MRVQPITNNIYVNKNINNRKADVISFQGFFNQAPSITDKFKAGLAALDNNTIFVVTRNKENSDFYLSRYIDKIDIPVHKIVTLEAPLSDDDKVPYVKDNFVVYKKDNQYKLMPLDSGYSVLRFYKNSHSLGEKIKNGEVTSIPYDSMIEIGGIDIKEKYFVFEDIKYNPSLADKYLKVNNNIATPEALARFNSQAFISINSHSDKQDLKTGGKQFTFADVGGLDDVIEECKKYITRPIEYPEAYKNIRLNKGILLYGPPRCGKTLLGKAIANEVGAKFAYVNGNEFKTGTVGSSEGNVRQAFDKLINDAPSILFIDEFDSIGKKRDGSSNARYDDSVVNQILGCMSDLEKNDALSFVVAATNRKDLLDPALLASGRFGVHLEIPMPNEEALSQIFDIHSKNKPFGDDISKPALINMMFKNSFNGSDVAECITNAYFNALERLGMYKKMDAKLFEYSDIAKIKISQGDFIKSIEKIAKLKG
ncbi:MAG: AAA family ATPase [bacterium]|nr:AAA family ATPase [bacterium]